MRIVRGGGAATRGRWRRRRGAAAGATALSIVLSAVGLSTATAQVSGPVFAVTSTADSPDARIDGICADSSGACTLRAAITEANAATAHATINFMIPGSGPHTIAPATRLPQLANPAGMTIDGYSQPGALRNTDPLVSNATIAIQLRGTGATNAGIDGFSVTSPDNVFRGLAMFDFRRNIYLFGTQALRNTIVGSYLCTDAAGVFGQTNVRPPSSGVLITQGAHDTVIGTSDVADRNVISGCAHRGVIVTNGSNRTKIQNNIVGLTPDGNARLANLAHGLDVNLGSQRTLIEGNVVSGNASSGIEISHGARTWYHEVIDNVIGGDPSGNAAPAYAANGLVALRIEGPKFCGELCGEQGGRNLVSGNVIVGNPKGGILIDKGPADNVVRDNLIGVTRDGTPAGNGLYGIRLERESTRNVIGPGNEIAYNQTGVQFQSKATQPPHPAQNTHANRITQNSIHDNTGYGIDLAPFGKANTAGVGDPLTNRGIQVPVISSASQTAITGTACPDSVVEVFYTDASATATKFGEGQTFLRQAVANASGAWSLTPPAGSQGRLVTAAATMADGSTSEFSRNKLVR